jgi:hypothetical protein
MRSQHTPLPLLGRQMAEWRLPIDADPAVDDAVMRMLHSLDEHLKRQQQPQESEA